MSTTTATSTRRVELAHEEGAAYLAPLSALVYGHDIDEDAARVFAQAEIDSWATEHDDGDTPSPRRRTVQRGQKVWVRMVPHEDGWSRFLFDNHGGRGASAIWLFEVDEHLERRCSVQGCDRPGVRGGGLYLPTHACATHARMFELRWNLQTALRMLNTGWIIGQPESDDYFGAMTTQQRRDMVLNGLDSRVTSLSDTIKRVATEMEQLEADGHTWPLVVDSGTTYIAWKPFNPANDPLYYFSEHEQENEYSRGAVHIIGGSAHRIKEGLNDALCGWKVPKGRQSLLRDDIKVGRVCERCAKSLGENAYRIVSRHG